MPANDLRAMNVQEKYQGPSIPSKVNPAFATEKKSSPEKKVLTSASLTRVRSAFRRSCATSELPCPPRPAVLSLEPIPLDPKLETFKAAQFLGRSVEVLKKWRQRGIGPKFIRYEDGIIRYALSAL